MAASLTRRQVLGNAALVAAGGLLAACSGGAAQSTPLPSAAASVAPSSVAPSAPAAPSAAAAASANASSAPPTMPTASSAPAAPSVASAAASATVPSAAPSAVAVAASAAPAQPSLASTIAVAANRFLDTLGAAARDTATYPFDDAERVRWHWTTPSGFPRNGLSLKEMGEPQRALALALLRESVSAEGFQKAQDIMSLQKDLGNDPLAYYVTVFGTPGGAAPWSWRFEGHHISRHFTVVTDKVAVTPLFHGSWPTITDAKLRALPREEDAARELVQSLTGAARDKAIFQKNTLTDHVTSNKPVVTPLAPVGIAYTELNAAGQALVLEIIQAYVGSQHPTIGEPMLARIRAVELSGVRFGWAGPVEVRRPQYYRLQGTTFLLEFDNSRNGGTHVHSVWRDFSGDFGHDLG